MFGLFHRLKRNRDTDALYSYEDDPSGGGPITSLPTTTRHAGYDAVSLNATYAAYPSHRPVVSRVGGLRGGGPEQYPNPVPQSRFLPSPEIPPLPKSGVPMEPIWVGPMDPHLGRSSNEPNRVRFSEDANKVHHEPRHSPTPSADAPEDDEKHSPVQESKPDSPSPDEKGKSHDDIGVQVGDIQPESRHGNPPSEAAAFPDPFSQSILPYTSFARPAPYSSPFLDPNAVPMDTFGPRPSWPLSYPTQNLKPRTLRLNLLSSRTTVRYEEISSRKMQRMGLDSLHSMLQDLLSCSFVPLTEYYNDPSLIASQATEFLSAFPDIAQWFVHVENIPTQQGQVLDGLTSNSRNPNVIARFLRFRFPYIRFEWHIETAYGLLSLSHMRRESTEMRTLWKAWSESGSASGLAAYGFCKDRLGYDSDGNLVIEKRDFFVSKVFQPEMMIPAPYPFAIPPLEGRKDFMIFSTSQNVIQLIRASQKRLGFLIAFSALLASLQPIVEPHSKQVGLALSIVGVVAATVSILSVFIGWALERIEATAPKYRAT